MPPKDADPKAEIARLRAKLATIQDRDIRAAIQERVDALAAQVVEPELPELKEVEVPEVPPEPPTPEQAERAERLVRQAMLERQRGNKAAVTKLLEEAAAVAPGAPATLEALGDDLAARSRVKEALDCYKRAIALDPKNVGLEKKHAMLVFNAGGAGSIEDQMRRLSDPVLLTQGDHVASYGVAKFVSYFIPGLGHVLLGRPGLGFGLIAGYVACFVWIGVLHSMHRGLNVKPGAEYFPPVFIALVILVAGVATLGGDRAAARSKSKPSHPRPPVDLPFD